MKCELLKFETPEKLEAALREIEGRLAKKGQLIHSMMPAIYTNQLILGENTKVLTGIYVFYKQ